MGLSKFTPQAWLWVQQLRATLPAKQRGLMHMTGTFALLLQVGHPIQVCAYEGRWGEIDSEPDRQYFQQQC